MSTTCVRPPAMRRIVTDTNVVVSGLLWTGVPQQVLDAGRFGIVKIVTCQRLLDELGNTLRLPKLQKAVTRTGLTADALVLAYSLIVELVELDDIPPVIAADPDDDVVLASAVAANASAIVSGDRHLLSLASHAGIPILSPAAFLRQLQRTRG